MGRFSVVGQHPYQDHIRTIARKMENGKWKMENGKWKMENGKRIPF
jgi:hypothetical protein